MSALSTLGQFWRRTVWSHPHNGTTDMTTFGPVARSLPTCFALRFLVLVVALQETVFAQQPASSLPFPSPSTPKLSANFQVSVSGQSLRELLISIENATRLPLILDRRVDPTAPAIEEPIPANVDLQVETPMRSKTWGPTLHQALDALVASRNDNIRPVENTQQPVDRERLRLQPIGWAAAGEVVLIGPLESVEAAANEILAARLRLQPHLDRFPARTIRWPMLTTPAEAMQVIADCWQLDTSEISLPHDLWPAIDLGEVHVSTALGVIASQFDLHFELDLQTRSIRQRPLNRKAVFSNRYPGLSLSPAQRQAITASGARLLKKNDQWELTGGASAHFQLELAIFRRGAAGKTSPKGVTRYTLKFAGTAGDAFRNLSQAGNLTLDMSALSDQQKQLMIELEVKDKTIEEILDAVAEKANLKVDIQGAAATVRPNEAANR